MRRICIALSLIALAMAGCTDAAEPTSGDKPETNAGAEPSSGQSPQPDTSPPEPVSIHEDEDLQGGYPHTTWTIPVSYGGSGSVYVAVEHPEDLQGISRNFCFSVHETWHHEDGSGQNEATVECRSLTVSTGDLKLYVGSFRGDVEGFVELAFSAEPQLMRFVLDAEVAYDA